MTDPTAAGITELLLIGGRSGVGKSTIAAELHSLLSERGVWHGYVEGDNLDMAYPAPWEQGLAERNLAAMWRNYRSLGHTRLVYVNTAAVVVADDLVAALDGRVSVNGVLLTATDDTARDRLSGREIGSGLDWHLGRSVEMAHRLEQGAADWVTRVATDDRSVVEVAHEVLELTGWV